MEERKPLVRRWVNVNGTSFDGVCSTFIGAVLASEHPRAICALRLVGISIRENLQVHDRTHLAVGVHESRSRERLASWSVGLGVEVDAHFRSGTHRCDGKYKQQCQSFVHFLAYGVM